MTFQQLLDGVEVLSQAGDPAVSSVEYDSRRVKKGTAFVAMRGETADGNKYVDAAISLGAVAIVTDSATEKPREGIAWAQVPHGRRALARLAANFYRHPAEKLATTGVTGTNGKSTTTFLVESILNSARRKNVLVGTIEYHLIDKVLPARHTTPESLELNQMLAEGLSNGATEAVMEVSSHALAQQRVFGIPFDVAVFTNLTRDHLDYHNTMEEYFASKRILFEGCGTEPPRVAVLTADDDYGNSLVKISKSRRSKVLTYGLAKADFRAINVQITTRGTRFELVIPDSTIPIWSPLIGRVNVYNILAAATAAYARGCQKQDIQKGVAQLKSVPGRFQRVDCGQPFSVVVDYAHTDDALKNLTTLAREFVSQSGSGGRVITLFGCGGDRDRAKRPLMGEAAGRGSDFVVLTSDNPRSEDPRAIINDALVGLQRTGVKYTIEPDRRVAVELAIGHAYAGDIVLIAGKGHEKVQFNREGSIPFDDAEVAQQILGKAGYDCPGSASAAGNHP
jgi:UDP-N-acetylmuramoyl-L-alanyl-D-glutamate--2,6-diaminopimelate ligase